MAATGVRTYRPGMLRSTSQCTEQLLATKNYPAPNVNRAKAEKPCREAMLRVCASCRSHGEGLDEWTTWKARDQGRGEAGSALTAATSDSSYSVKVPTLCQAGSPTLMTSFNVYDLGEGSVTTPLDDK